MGQSNLQYPFWCTIKDMLTVMLLITNKLDFPGSNINIYNICMYIYMYYMYIFVSGGGGHVCVAVWACMCVWACVGICVGYAFVSPGVI